MAYETVSEESWCIANNLRLWLKKIDLFYLLNIIYMLEYIYVEYNMFANF